MRILHVITMLDTGGAERLMVDLLPRLRNLGHDVELLLFNGVDTPFRAELERQGIKIHELSHGHDVKKYRFRVYNPWNFVKMRKYLRHYDIIHTHNTACQLYAAMSRALFGGKVKLVTTEHNTTNRRRDMAWFKPIDRWMYRQYSKVVCISEKTMENLKAHLGIEVPMCVINNGVNVQRFMRPVADVAGKKQFVIAMVSAFREQKDHATLIKAMTHLPENYTLKLVGDGIIRPQFEELSKELSVSDRVEFMGNQMDIPGILENSDVVVLSSHWEGLSLSSVEGMASGHPFVATDVDGLHEIVSGAGVLVPHYDDVALANEIRDLCENPERYRKVAEACQERAQRYDITVMAEGYSNLYRSLSM